MWWTQLTIMAVREAVLPENCSRTIYMCDDGKDPLKRDWVDSLGPDVIYVSGEPSTVECAAVHQTSAKHPACGEAMISATVHVMLASIAARNGLTGHM